MNPFRGAKHFILLVALTVAIQSCTAGKVRFGRTPMPLPRPRPSPAFLGIHMEPLPSDSSVGSRGIRVTRVIIDSPAEKAGLRAGDIILKYDGRSLADLPAEKMIPVFRNYIQWEKSLHTPLSLEILRIHQQVTARRNNRPLPVPVLSPEALNELLEKQPVGDTLTLRIEKRAQPVELKARLSVRYPAVPAAPPNSELFPQYEDYSDPLIRLARGLISAVSIQEDYRDLIERFRQNETWDDGFRSPFLRYIHRDPLKFPQMAEDLASTLRQSVLGPPANPAAAIGIVTPLLAEPLVPLATVSAPVCGPGAEACLEKVLAQVDQVRDLRRQAFHNLKPDEIRFLQTHLEPALNRFLRFAPEGEQADEATFARVQHLVHRVDYASLYQAGRLLLKLSGRDWLAQLKASLTHSHFNRPPAGAPGVSGDIRLAFETENGWVVVGGPGPTRYTQDLMLTIDLGGDDLYLNSAGGARGAGLPVSVLIDLAGDDIYSATEPAAQGAAVLGNGLLVDLDGNDTYMAGRTAQGSAILGTGALIDYAGADRYIGQEILQGCGFWGIGLLLDFQGADRYRAHLAAQGVGGVKSAGLLVDGSGDDRYEATGKIKSGYGTSGIYRGMSQGFGYGFREESSGGIGLLLDAGGRDQFTAGNFSQGGGYFYGVGMLINQGHESDTYLASRYGQGFCAHSAAGLLLDEGGDDTYRGLRGALQSAAWDLGIAVLVDGSGNDLYDAEGLFFSQAAAAHNGFSWFMDLGGRDTYRTAAEGIAAVPSNSYHGGSSLALFIDGGGSRDRYPDGPGNNRVSHRGKNAVFADLPEPVADIDPGRLDALLAPFGGAKGPPPPNGAPAD